MRVGWPKLYTFWRQRQWESEKKWEVVSHVWVEMMAYAATHCQWQYHARQLTKGGELLPHVSLLMAHLGISEQFQISEGHGRVKMLLVSCLRSRLSRPVRPIGRFLGPVSII
ncbi:hypothetical protein ACSBR2_030236 [Camellia fascicularis]